MITPDEWDVLHKLAEKCPNGKKWCFKYLANALDRDAGSISRTCHKFADKNLFNFPWVLLKESSVEGHRITYISLTQTGKKHEKLESVGIEPVKGIRITVGED